jgi:L-asparaginase II
VEQRRAAWADFRSGLILAPDHGLTNRADRRQAAAMANPVLIEVTRGQAVESRHRAAFALSDAHGRLRASAGDVDVPIYPRSSVKALQALALVENGWADQLGLDEAELALMCASHGGEPIHVETARGLLAKVGRSEADLECGVHWPSNRDAARAMTAAGLKPSALHNNCSGKHAGFLCLACALKVDPAGYVGADHPVQRTIAAVLAETYGTALTDPGIDGCSIPTYAVPLRQLAQAFAKLGSGEGLGPKRAAAARRLREAVAAHPVLVASHGGLDTRIAEHFGTRVFTKGGAEGVFCAALPEQGLGLALKCDDGSSRGAEALCLGLLARVMQWMDEDRAVFKDGLDPVLRNWNGIAVGQIRTIIPSLK